MLREGSYLGKRCFIIASGPSTKSQDLSWLKDEITIAVNQAYKILDFEPTFICISDLGLWGEIKDIYAKMKSKIIACFADPKKIRKEYKGNNLALVFRNLGKIKHPQYSWKIMNGVHSSANVVTTVALPFAHWAGFEATYLVGCDCTNEGYSYSEGLRMDKQEFVPMTMDMYRKISTTKNRPGFIYNATVGGCLEYFPRVDFDTLRREFLVVAYFTKGNRDYREAADSLRTSAKRFSVLCEIVEVEDAPCPTNNPQLKWALNANICPFFLQEMRKKYPNKDLFYIDVDADFKKIPNLFINHPRLYDFAAVFISNHRYKNQLCGGGLYFAATPKGNELLDKWCEVQSWRNDEIRDGVYNFPCLFPSDQETLQHLLPLISGLNWAELPLTYGYIIPRENGRQVMQEVKNPVIEHYQASRKHRSKSCIQK